MGTVSFEVPGPGTYNVTCDPKLDPLANSGTAGDILSGKQFYNDQNTPVTGTMPNNGAVNVELAAGGSYTVPAGYHNGSGKVTSTSRPLPSLTNPGTAADLLKDKELIDQSGNVVTGTLEPVDTSDATATAGDILSHKTAYTASGKVTGTISTKGDSDVTADGPTVAVPPGYYPQAVNKTVSDPDLIPGNIKEGVEIFGVTGTFEGGLPEGVRTITLIADPPEGGTVSGGGVASDGMTLTVNAQPNEADNYSFEGWKENGAVVESDPAYTFSVTEARSLIASFLQSQYTPGVDWWASSLPSSDAWHGLAYGNGKFVAVANSAGCAYSSDGIHWTAITMPSSWWQGVAYGNGKFVAISSGNSAAYSTDGVNWTAATLPSSENWISVTYGGGKFVAVVNGSNKCAYSTDGITWTAATMPETAGWTSLCYGNGKFVAIGGYYSGSERKTAAYSTDGIHWTSTPLPSNARWGSVAFGGGKFVAISPSSTKAAYSEDGITWTAATLPSSGDWKNVTYGSGKFVAVINGSSNAAYSEDGITWVPVTLPSSAKWYSIIYGNGTFVTVAKGSTQTAYSRASGPET